MVFTSLYEKNVLIYFFDIEQQPSKNCVLVLNKKAKELKEKDISIVLFHALKIEQAKIDEWTRENNIVFSVGMIKENEEQTRFDWVVKALPWLILTDKEHIVTAEGFLINELEGKIMEVKNVQ